jgi:D-sedoheptulose 7-phosphate isomerase
MDFDDRIRSQLRATTRALEQTVEDSQDQLIAAAELLAERLAAGSKVLACGNGGSAADAQHFAAELTGRFERERVGLAAVSLTTDTSALTAIGNDYGFERIFSRQVEALGRTGDVLLAISTSGNSRNVLKAMEAAQERGMNIIALSGRDGGQIARGLRATDVEIRAASAVTARIQEVHIFALHALCDLVDLRLFGRDD